MAGELPRDFARARAQSSCRRSNAKAETIATRKASQNALEALVPALPELIGGSADLDRLEPHHGRGLEGDRARRTAATTSTSACASSACARS